MNYAFSSAPSRAFVTRVEAVGLIRRLPPQRVAAAEHGSRLDLLPPAPIAKTTHVRRHRRDVTSPSRLRHRRSWPPLARSSLRRTLRAPAATSGRGPSCDAGVRYRTRAVSSFSRRRRSAPSKRSKNAVVPSGIVASTGPPASRGPLSSSTYRFAGLVPRRAYGGRPGDTAHVGEAGDARGRAAQ